MSKVFDVLDEIIQKPDFPENRFWWTHQVEADSAVITQGDQSTTLYLIRTGRVRVMGRVTLDDNKQVSPGVCDLGPGEVFGELVLFDEGPRSATVKTLEPSELVAINAGALKEYFEKNQDYGYMFLRELTALLVTRLRESNEKIFSLLAWGLKAHQIEQHL